VGEGYVVGFVTVVGEFEIVGTGVVVGVPLTVVGLSDVVGIGVVVFLSLVNVVGVNQAAAETGSSATHVLSASSELDRQAESLRSEVSQFLTKIRAA